MELFRRPLGWFLLTLAIVAFVVATAFAQLFVVAYVALWFAGWTFVVWTVAVGVRVGLAGLRLETVERDRPANPHYPYSGQR